MGYPRYPRLLRVLYEMYAAPLAKTSSPKLRLEIHRGLRGRSSDESERVVIGSYREAIGKEGIKRRVHRTGSGVRRFSEPCKGLGWKKTNKQQNKATNHADKSA